MAGNIEDSIRFVERLIENPNTDLDSIIIELGDKNDRVERRMNGNQVIFRVPKSYYETLRIKLDGEKAVKRLRINTERKERSRFIDEGAKDIDAIFESRTAEERKKVLENYSNNSRPSSKQQAEKHKRAIKRIKRKAEEEKKRTKKEKRLEKKNKKRELKNKANKNIKVSNQKEIFGRRIKALGAGLVVGVGMTAGGVALDHYMSDYHETAQSVKGMSVNEIKDLARNEFIQAISADTSVPVENIKITKTNVSSSEERTEMTFTEGEQETTYTLNENKRDPVNYGSIEGNITRIFSIIDNAGNEREAINALMKERNFVKKNKVKKGEKISVETRPTETKSEGTQDMDEYTL